jgi:hypothetical protein
MRRLLVTAAAVVGTTGCLTLVVNGVAGPSDRSRLFGTTPATAVGLTEFGSCQELLDWYVDRTLPHVGPYGLEPDPGIGIPGSVTSRDQALATEDSLAGAAAPEQTSSSTGTNVQEVGVDEPDLAKTDGQRVIRVDGAQLVVTDVRGDVPRELGRLELPTEMYAPEILLAGDRVLVLQAGTTDGGPVLDVAVPGMPYPGAGDTSRLLEVSIADPTSPRVVGDQHLGGSVVTARLYEPGPAATVRLVLRTGEPTIDWVQPHRSRSASAAKEENKDLLRASTIENWLPSVEADGKRRPLVDCADVRHPRRGKGPGTGTVTVVSMPADDAGSWRSTAVAAASETVYSSTDRLYLATTAAKDETHLHAFALGAGDARYVASGRLEGSLRDRWSLDEHDGVLRAAVAHGPGWAPTENGITTLREDDDRLVTVGSVRGLGPDEEIKAVRWFDDLAVVVTFRQTDPLYTVDLSDPARPRTVGELKIPGFSRYLHPIGAGRLVGIGQDADLDGVTRGAQGAVFDIRDLAEPRRLSTLSLGQHTYALAEDDPRAFTWLPGSATALTSVTDHHGGSWLLAVRVSPEGELQQVDSWSLPPWSSRTTRTLPLDGSRVALVSGEVRIVSVH